MGNMVKKEEYGVEKHILIANNSYMVTLPAIIKQGEGTPDSNGRTIAKAGSPLFGNIEKRDVGFKVRDLEGKPSCVLLHDVDTTDGDANGTIVIAGCVDWLKLDDDAKSLYSNVNKSDLPRIIFVEGSAI